MVPEKYAALGFVITKFGANSRVLRYHQKPVFVFNTNAGIDIEFLKCICDTYLQISGKRKSPVSIRIDD